MTAFKIEPTSIQKAVPVYRPDSWFDFISVSYRITEGPLSPHHKGASDNLTAGILCSATN
jgi:hypothetical protein